MSDVNNKDDSNKSIKHFNKVSGKYSKVRMEENEINMQIAEVANPLIKGSVLLDVGGGGLTPYDNGLADKLIILDLSQAMLDKINIPGAELVCDDARSMDKIEDVSVDVVLCSLCLHHISGSTYKKSCENMRNVIVSAKKKLKVGGKLIIVEPVCNSFWSFFERLLYPVTKFILGALGRDMIFFYSKDDIYREISNGFFNHQPAADGAVEWSRFKLTKKFDALGGSFPGLIQLHPAFFPASFQSFVATKR